jgi:hypothetical protein
VFRWLFATNDVIDLSGPNIASRCTSAICEARSSATPSRASAVPRPQRHRQNHLGDWARSSARRAGDVVRSGLPRTGQSAKLGGVGPSGRTIAAGVVVELAELHQKFVDQDPMGQAVLAVPPQNNSLTLDDLDRAYAFVSIVTDAEEAQQVSIRHPLHDKRTLAELPRLVHALHSESRYA